MNFVDPKEYNYPGLVRKNRYKTILPSEYGCNAVDKRHHAVVNIVKTAFCVSLLLNNFTCSSTIYLRSFCKMSMCMSIDIH